MKRLQHEKYCTNMVWAALRWASRGFPLLPSPTKTWNSEFKSKRPKQHRALYRAICSYKSECNLYMRKGLLVLHWLPQLLSCRYRDSDLFSEKIWVLPLCKSSVRPYGNDNISMTPYLSTGACNLVRRFCIHSNNTCSFRVYVSDPYQVLRRQKWR